LDTTFLDNIPFQPDLPALKQQLRIRPGSAHEADLELLASQAQQLARPKAYYRSVYIDSRDGDSLVMEGVSFTSRVLRVNLEPVHRVFISLATCGRELEAWAASQEDMLARFSADILMEHALGVAYRAIEAHLVQHYHPGKVSTMNPGSLEDWPLTEQGPLFTLLGEGAQLTGVELTPSYLMLPRKSVSGIFFPAEVGFESCMLCPRADCTGRRAPYQPELTQTRYGHA
jgi:hypothetical protein